MKGVLSCEKPRGAAKERRSGDTRMGQPTGEELRYVQLKEVGCAGEPGELNHLSTPRSRNQPRFSE